MASRPGCPLQSICFMMACFSEQAVQVWYPSVTPSALSGLQPAAGCLFTGEAGQWSTWTRPEPVPTPSACGTPQLQLDLQHSLLFFSSAFPKDRLTTSHFFYTHTHTHTCSEPDDSAGILTGFSFSTKWQNSRRAGENTAAQAHEFMENGTLSTI